MDQKNHSSEQKQKKKVDWGGVLTTIGITVGSAFLTGFAMQAGANSYHSLMKKNESTTDDPQVVVPLRKVG